jgi:NAD(P)-dependent dehydrogenase (short-subunit alcohol dehydrogenase family)
MAGRRVKGAGGRLRSRIASVGMGAFDGKVAIVTGGASGIGAASVRRFAAEGAQVLAIDVDEARGRAVASEAGARFERMDVGDPDAWARLVRAAEDDLGGVDLAHLNAGVATGAYPVDIATLSDAQYRRVMGVNVDGVVFGVRALVPAMARRGGGAIVVTSSLAGLMPLPDDPVYGGTKHFVIGLVRSLATPLGEQGITINAVCPGAVDTALLDTTGRGDELRGSIPRMPPDDVAVVAARLLAGDETGSAYSVLPERGSARYEFAPVAGRPVTDLGRTD